MTRSLRIVLTAALSVMPGLLLPAASRATTGLRFMTVLRKDAGVAPLDGARGMAMSSDGKHVYVTSRLDDTVSVFSRNATTGALTFVESYQHKDDTDGLNGVDAVAVSPDGKNVYAVSDIDSCVVTFARDAATGKLTFLQLRRDGVGKTNGISNAEAVRVSPDGLHVYVAGTGENAIGIFSRDQSTGVLTYIDMVKDGVNGATGLLSVKAISITADGAYLYVAASAGDDVQVFRRDATTGLLTSVQIAWNLQDGITDMDKPRGLALSPDNQNLYVTGGLDDALCVFNRDAATGMITETQVSKNKVDGVRGLNGSNKVVVSKDGLSVYTTADVDDGISIFDRDPATGQVTFVQRVKDDTKDPDGLLIDGLNGAWGIVASPDGLDVYATGYIDDAVAVFRKRLCGDGIKDPGETCDDGNTAGGDCCSATCQLDDVGVACTGDGNACTDDVCDGKGACTHPNNTAPCDDGAFCTVNDVCAGGSCHGGQPRDCSAAGDQCNTGVCNESLDACVPQPKTDGTSCNDGVNCTRPDVCKAGVCTGTPVVCASADACHDSGSCDEATGLCPNPRPDGTACNDGDACTTVDSCQRGLCTGSDPVVCGASDQCHGTGTCNHSTGLCSNPAKPNGTACNDGSACTNGDACQGGVCLGGTAVVCGAADQCHEAGVCDGNTGTCSNPAKLDGSACDDGNADTEGDVCGAGVCAGRPLADRDGDGIPDVRDVCPDVPNPDQADSNHDGIGDACQCDQPAPGHCVTGGGPAKTDCLLEFNTTGPVTPNKKRTGVLGVLHCKDGDPACDRDGRADGTCTFGIALCLGNSDPRLKCTPADVHGFEVMSPNADKAHTPIDKANALALERSLGTLGIQVSRAGRIITAFSASKSEDMCSPLVDVAVPAPSGAKPTRRTFKMRGTAADGRTDLDKLTLECVR